MLEKLLNEVLQAALGSAPSTASSPLQQILGSLLGGSQDGLAGLVEQFASAGLGREMQSWISTGQNLPISADQLLQVLGQGRMQELAQQAGMAPAQLGGHLAELLPQVIDRMTPNGQLPQGGIENALGELSRLMPR